MFYFIMNKLFILLLLLIIGCSNIPHTNNPLIPLPTSDQCLNAEIHLRELCDLDNKKNVNCCRLYKNNNKTYSKLCIEQSKQNTNLNPVCISNISNCSQGLIDSCYE